MGKEKLSQAGAEFSPEEKSIWQSRCLVGRRRDAPGNSLQWKCKKREWGGAWQQWPRVCIWTDGLDLRKKFLRTRGFPFKSWANLWKTWLVFQFRASASLPQGDSWNHKRGTVTCCTDSGRAAPRQGSSQLLNRQLVSPLPRAHRGIFISSSLGSSRWQLGIIWFHLLMENAECSRGNWQTTVATISILIFWNETSWIT